MRKWTKLVLTVKADVKEMGKNDSCLLGWHNKVKKNQFDIISWI